MFRVGTQYVSVLYRMFHTEKSKYEYMYRYFFLRFTLRTFWIPLTFSPSLTDTGLYVLLTAANDQYCPMGTSMIGIT